MRVTLVQLDGAFPNLALMRLAGWHRGLGDEVTLIRRVADLTDLYLPRPDRVYASTIFQFSRDKIAELRAAWPDAIIGGTGLGPAGAGVTLESVVGEAVACHPPDYTDYPHFTGSLGFTQRGCRLSCKFCVVPTKEGKNRAEMSIADIWRGPPWPRHIHLLDNDFFGQGEDQWRARVDEIKRGGFQVCFNQGINIRLINKSPGSAEALASIPYRDDGFKQKRLYTAWDNLKDEKIFFEGVETLRAAGVPPHHLMVYMLIGYDKNETWDRIHYRFEKMRALGVKPYPMVFDMRATNPGLYRDLKHFQRWAIWLSGGVKWADYVKNTKRAQFTAMRAEPSAPKLSQVGLDIEPDRELPAIAQ
jgi:hypothetical protein